MEGNGSAPVTREDLQEFKRELVSKIGEMMDTRFHQIDEQFTERLHDTETRLLKAFYQYQEHSDVRMRKMSADISNMDTASDLRLNNLERRVIELERKILDSDR
jgi:polyhydroxyalkanoate synthesis regulator phasin